MPIMKHGPTNQIRGLLFHLSALGPLLIVYLCLAFYQIGHQSLWVDEVVSVQVASEEFSNGSDTWIIFGFLPFLCFARPPFTPVCGHRHFNQAYVVGTGFLYAGKSGSQ